MSDNRIIALTMPKWGLTMEEGTISSWLMDEGDTIEVGSEILEVETDKIAQPVESAVEGILRRKIGEEDEEYPVKALIGIIAAEDVTEEEIDAFIASYGGEGAEGSDEDEAPAETAAAPEGIYELTMPKWGLTMEEGTISSWLIDEGDEVEVGTEIMEVETDKIAQPVESTVAGVLRRKIGEEDEEYPVKALIGIIADASVSDADIDAYLASRGGEAASGDEEEEAAAPAQPTSKPMSAMRAAISNTVTNSWTIPQFPVTMGIEMGAAKEFRAGLKAAGKAVSMNDMVIRACGKAIEQYPMVNATLGGKEYGLNADVNIAVAVGTDDALMMPVVKGCQALSLEEVASASRAVIDKVKAGTCGPAEMAGGNFAISNLGMLGVDSFGALVPPGMSAILAVGGIKDEVVVKDGEMVPVSTMKVTLVADHRVVDGLYSAQFLVELKRLLENPEEL
ncbi:acetoin dehydrogenase complex, E2 protein, dihydrolipoamide acetyltransferase [Syntrophotalea carbinolica DSM 2380]|uniref:Dihydrolipoamide acetyltransferase component of pyruvate dehydrogenase complex n=1 Tax=Syntrophotalea carbinolica (strain DSM 2380 / NBRC 103641 / GraBd1) TaxID=338963 RepID=Q3A7N9_SYNC1|nr:2-oxo acid dehydrogenase subunit E2 [Syntrophotalea carbinolica]ABA87605.1 acetoin dehydrogenase complex, E2 protein, dihydrolipoamide acetyltransferase [Syntrophotalea carbinolica DSM 2380]